MGRTENLLIFGASARAAACSALRAGLRPWCGDLFADQDLQALCPVMRLPGGGYPQGFLRLVETDLPGPWMYAGGLENWPTLVRQMARRRKLWGNNEAELVRARNPDFVTRTLLAAGLPAPAIRWHPQDLSPGFRWLVKPLRSAGGGGIRPWEGSRKRKNPRPVYLQEYIEGEPCSGLYVADRSRAWLLGLTRQLVGADYLHAAPFRYCGSVGPLEVSRVRRPDLGRLGAVLAGACGLRGLFGVDGVLRDGVFWPVEINPRYTASVEVIEHGTGVRALSWHRTVFESGRLPRTPPPAAPASGCVGKAILFAREALSFPPDGPWLSVLRSPPAADELPPFADVPAAGERIEAGRPVLTFFARAATADECEAALRRTAADLDHRLFGR